MDFVNQGKGCLLEIWKTNDHNMIYKIHIQCIAKGENLYHPSQDFRKEILRKFKLEEKQ